MDKNKESQTTKEKETTTIKRCCNTSKSPKTKGPHTKRQKEQDKKDKKDKKKNNPTTVVEISEGETIVNSTNQVMIVTENQNQSDTENNSVQAMIVDGNPSQTGQEEQGITEPSTMIVEENQSQKGKEEQVTNATTISVSYTHLTLPTICSV